MHILYVGCPSSERQDMRRQLASSTLDVQWADTTANALSVLQRRNLPVLLDLSVGTAALRTAREVRVRRPRTLVFAVADLGRPDLTAAAVASGVADVFSRPLGPSRVINALEREGAQHRRAQCWRHESPGDD